MLIAGWVDRKNDVMYIQYNCEWKPHKAIKTAGEGVEDTKEAYTVVESI